MVGGWPLALGIAAALVTYNTVTNRHPSRQVTYVGRNLATGLLLVAVARSGGLSWDELGLGATDLARGLRWGGVAALVVAVGTGVVWLLAGRAAWATRLLSDRRADLLPRALAFHVLVRIPVGTAAFEEVVFRGVLLAAFLAVVPAVWAVAASSIVFGLWHVAPTRRTLDINGIVDAGARRREIAAAVVVTSVGGVVFSLLRLGSGSVLAPVLAHAAVNGSGLVAAAAFRRSRRATGSRPRSRRPPRGGRGAR